MRPPLEQHAAPEIRSALSELFGGTAVEVVVRYVGESDLADFELVVDGYRFVAEYKGIASSSAIARGIQTVQRLATEATTHNSSEIPVLIVPCMGPVGRQLCAASHISWFDLSGNASIVAPGLRILVDGRPNRFIERGRPPNLFAAKSSRVVRELLRNPRLCVTQAQLARGTGLDDGYVSKIVRRLIDEDYVRSDDSGCVQPRDPDLLLDAWRESYDFSRHRILKGHVPARSGDELLRRLAEKTNQAGPRWAITGLGAAWLYTRFAAFRLLTAFFEERPPDAWFVELGFAAEPRGANLWIVMPDDEGVFAEVQQVDGVRCVSPLQAYLDLKANSERAEEAATELRARLLNWSDS
jgi:hypothetical protein